MIFRIERPGPRATSDTGTVPRITLSSPDGRSRVVILPESGGTIESLRLPLYFSSEEVLVGNLPFAGCILWPFNDRIRRGGYKLQGRDYQLRTNEAESGDAIHGFLYRMGLEIQRTEATTRSAVVSLVAALNPEDEPGYPFQLGVTVTYTLHERSFSLEVVTENLGNEAAPLTLGWHPYFSLPRHSSTVDELLLQTSADEYYPVKDDLIPTGETRPVTDSLFDFTRPEPIGRREIDMCFRGTEPIVTTLSSPRGSLRIVHETGFERLQLYIPPDRTAIAVEPVRAAADAFNNPDLGLTVLQPGERNVARSLITSS